MTTPAKNKALRALGVAGVLATLIGCASAPSARPDAAAATAAPAAATPGPAAPSATQKARPEKAPAPLVAESAAEEAENETPVVVKTKPTQEAEEAANQREYANLWDRIRAGFKMARMEGPLVESHERWFVNNPDYMERMLQRANLYLFHIVEEVEKRGLPMEIALLPAIESAYQPRAFSRARASGLWQFMPATGRLYGLKSDWWYDGRRDVLASTRAALDYLEKLNKDFDGDWQLALASYNCGEGKVGRMREYNRRRGLPTDYQDLKLPRETVHYVPKLMAMVNIVANPERYGLELREIPNSPYFVQVDTGSQIDLGVVAKLTNLELDDLYNMNPGFNRWATSPQGPHRLLIPVSTKDALMEGLNELPPEDRMQWARHQVTRGETLTRVARNFGVDAEVIRSVNKLSGTRLRPGQNLLIPVTGRKLLVAEGGRASESEVQAGLKHVAQQGGDDNKVRVVHRVRSGETLWSIARRYNVYVGQLAKWNFMGVRDTLKMGQKLLIWTTPRKSSALERTEAQPANG